jgi:hypothetical protein
MNQQFGNTAIYTPVFRGSGKNVVVCKPGIYGKGAEEGQNLRTWDICTLCTEVCCRLPSPR